MQNQSFLRYNRSKPCPSKIIITLLSLILGSVLAFIITTNSLVQDYESPKLHSEEILEFMKWQVQHQKQYFSLEEQNSRFKIWRESKLEVQVHNSQPDSTFEMGLSRFSDLTQEEFGQIHPQNSNQILGEKVEEFTDSDQLLNEDSEEFIIKHRVNWAKRGAVTPVKNQGGSCHSEWAFATTGAIEAAYFLKNNKLLSFSEQQLIDCTGSCRGGLSYTAFQYLKTNKIQLESDHPYQGKEGQCPNSAQKGVTLVNHKYYARLSNAKLLQLVSQQPVVVQVNMQSIYFRNYKSGVLPAHYCYSHGWQFALLVGYDLVKGYWLVKNSWGEEWGDNGYIKLQFGPNTCGILSSADMAIIP